MRLFSWYGLSALLIALGFGYVAGMAHRTTTCESCFPPSIPSHEEEALAPPPGLVMESQRLTPPEVIDLTCAPSVVLPFELFTQTVEPPAADAMIRQTTFELPAGPSDGIEPIPFMPHLDDEPHAASSFSCELDIPLGNRSFQYSVAPFFYVPCDTPLAPTATAIALGYSTWFANLPK
jgi:hypothetical protein